MSTISLHPSMARIPVLTFDKYQSLLPSLRFPRAHRNLVPPRPPPTVEPEHPPAAEDRRTPCHLRPGPVQVTALFANQSPPGKMT